MPTTPPETVRTAQPAEDGAGVKIRRINDFTGSLDPFLLLDELKASNREDYVGGFPPHPHRGFETLTYLIHGGVTHEDSMGNRGEVHAGEAQWMSAGRGVIHSEMPLLDSDGLHGFQIWINLPAARKMDPPRYRDVRAAEMVTAEGDGVILKAIAGRWSTSTGRIEGPIERLGNGAALADVSLNPGAGLTVEVDSGERVIAYVYSGSLGDGLDTASMGIWSNQSRIELASSEGARLLLLRGHPLEEPIRHHGPFVMNTDTEIRQAIADFEAGRLATPPVSVA